MLNGNGVPSAALRIPPFVTITFGLLTVAGVVCFIAGVLSKDPLRAWQAYLVNFLFWTGLSFGAVLFVAVLNITGARWGRPLKRLGEAFGVFLPVVFVFFLLLYFGRFELFPWIRDPVPGREMWLNVPFLFIRNGIGILLLSAIAAAMILYSLKSDGQWRASFREGEEAIAPEGRLGDSWRKQQILSPIMAIAYAFVMTLLAFDLIMSLDRHWYSTLLGGYFLVGSFYTGVVAIYILALIVGRIEGFKDHLGPRHSHDLGKLVLAFCLFTGYLFYAQFLTIWYANVPAETRYVILRVKLTPWEPLAWVTLVTVFLLPSILLLSRKIKLKRAPMIFLSIVILAGMWSERFILVVPSLWKHSGIPLGVTEALVTAGYLGIVGLCVTGFLARVPSTPVSDPLFTEAMAMNKERLEP
jgi:hypothetical protein